jgi:hypothetical protein
MKNRILHKIFRKRSFTAQGMVEFALVLPLLLILIFGIIEFGRIFQAWLSVQNSARFAIRYAVTGQYNTDYCDNAATAEANNDVFKKYLTFDISPIINPATADTYNGDPQDCRIPLDFAESLKTIAPFSGMDPNGAALAVGNTIQNMTEVLQDYARLESIHDITRNDAFAIAADHDKSKDGSITNTDKGYFQVIVLSSRVQDYCIHKLAIDWFACVTYSDPSLGKYWSAGPHGFEDPGGPGDSVQIGVDFNHPLITPFLMQAWPFLQLTTIREARVEDFRSSKSVNIAPPLSMPSPTASLTPSITPTPTATSTPTFTPSPTATETFTPTNTYTPTDTLTPSLTPSVTLTLAPTSTFTPSKTPQPSNTPTITPTPNCNLLSITSFTGNSNTLSAVIRNQNPIPVYFTGAYLTWTKYYAGEYLSYWQLTNPTLRLSDVDDSTSPSAVSYTSPIAANSSRTLQIRFAGFTGYLHGDFSLTVYYDLPGCSDTASMTARTPTVTNTPAPPTNTPTRTPITPTATKTPITPTATKTPVTPTSTSTPVTPTKSPTSTPVTPTATKTPITPTATKTNTPITPTATPVTPTTPPTATRTPTKTPTNTPSGCGVDC